MTLPRRLLLAFLLICAVGVVCWVILPRYGVWAPPEIVFIGYLVILASCLLAAKSKDDGDPEVVEPPLDETPQAIDRDEDPPVAGRIGPR